MESKLKMPLVSVVVPTYNREATIRRSLISVLSQTYTNLELIVVDDGSTDATVNIVSDLDDSRVRYISTGGRKGACFARNLGVQKANGKLIAFQDSDDIWLPHKLAIQINQLMSSNAKAVFSRFVRVSESALTCELYPDIKTNSEFTLFKPGYDYVNKGHLRKNTLSTQTLLIYKDVFSELGGFDVKLPRFQDWDFSIRLFERYQVGFVREPLVNVYIQSDSLTKNFKAGIEARFQLLDSNRDIYKKHLRYRAIFITDIMVRTVYARDYRGLLASIRRLLVF